MPVSPVIWRRSLSRSSSTQAEVICSLSQVKKGRSGCGWRATGRHRAGSGAIMGLVDAGARLAAGRMALRGARWDEARRCFEATLAVHESPDALDGLGTALWWLDEPAAGMLARARAYAGYRREGRAQLAGRIAVWLAREHRTLFRDAALAGGWLARARSLVIDPDSALQGWVLVAEAEASHDGRAASELARRAVGLARRCGDADLEIIALARSGSCAVASGAIDRGLGELNEAMAAATAGEARDPQCVAEVLCVLVEAAGWLGDPGRIASWAKFLVEFGGGHEFGPLLSLGTTRTVELVSSFCGACCGGVYLVTGRLDAAETELSRAVADLAASGVHPRCLHPVAALAELRLAQGRLEEAEALLAPYETLRECVAPAAALDVAQGRPGRAVARLEAAIESHAGEPVRLVPWWALLVDAALQRGDLGGAERAATEVSRVAGLSGSALHRAHAELGRGKVAASRGEPRATTLLRAAAQSFAESDAPLLACRARVALAEALLPHDRGLAVTEARSALRAFERLGATFDADRAAAFLKRLGVRGRTGPKGVGVLTRREQEVLRLVAEGLSNAEIARQLFISVKTAGHHVSNILNKLGLRSRTEAAAYAVLHPVAPRGAESEPARR